MIMRKNIIQFKFKEFPDDVQFCESVIDIFNKYGKERLGCVIGSVWNGISRKGYYSNKVVEIRRVPLIQAVRMEDGTIVEVSK